MNNTKGQVLVLFCILLPILLLLVAIIVDVGFAYYEKRKIEHVMKDTIVYALDHITEEKTILKTNMAHLLNENIDDIYEIVIKIEENNVELHIEKRLKGLFSFMKIPYQMIKLQYKGTSVDGIYKIRKE